MNEQRDNQNTGIGIAIGAGGGVALGLVLATILDNPGFFAAGIAIGMSLGGIIGATLDLRSKRNGR